MNTLMDRKLLLLALASLAAATLAHSEPARPYEGELMITEPTLTRLATSPRALEVLKFWTDAGPARWFAKDPEFDRTFRDRFLADHESAARGELMHWQSTAEGALALVILLDQYPRHAFRDTRRMYDTDALARKVANTAFATGYDRLVSPPMQTFFLLPFGHSEDLADQERAVALARRISAKDLQHAEHHRDIVRRFGRFPHRNEILGRDSTAEEIAYLENGGYRG